MELESYYITIIIEIDYKNILKYYMSTSNSDF